MAIDKAENSKNFYSGKFKCKKKLYSAIRVSILLVSLDLHIVQAELFILIERAMIANDFQIGIDGAIIGQRLHIAVSGRIV